MFSQCDWWVARAKATPHCRACTKPGEGRGGPAPRLGLFLEVAAFLPRTHPLLSPPRSPAPLHTPRTRGRSAHLERARLGYGRVPGAQRTRDAARTLLPPLLPPLPTPVRGPPRRLHRSLQRGRAFLGSAAASGACLLSSASKTDLRAPESAPRRRAES